jgi:hypothetical protein
VGHFYSAVYKSHNNEVYNNVFTFYYTPEDPAYIHTDSLSNVFHLSAPVGGNFWSIWSAPDANGDGFVDSPFVFPGGQNNLPWANPNGWLTPEVQIKELVAEVVSLNLQQGITNSLDSKLDAVLKALEDVNENNDGAAIGALGAFINAVNAQRGGKITEEDADALIEMAQQIIDLLTNG